MKNNTPLYIVTGLSIIFVLIGVFFFLVFFLDWVFERSPFWGDIFGTVVTFLILWLLMKYLYDIGIGLLLKVLLIVPLSKHNLERQHDPRTSIHYSWDVQKLKNVVEMHFINASRINLELQMIGNICQMF